MNGIEEMMMKIMKDEKKNIGQSIIINKRLL